MNRTMRYVGFALFQESALLKPHHRLSRKNFDIKIKSNLRYTRGITLKRGTSGEVQLRSIAPGQHISEKTLQRWRAVRDTASDLTGLEIEPRPAAPLTASLTITLTVQLDFDIVKLNFLYLHKFLRYSSAFYILV